MKHLKSTEMLICGAGPIGLFLGICLSQANYRVLVIEKRKSLSNKSRAIGILPPSLAIMKEIGLASLFLSRGKKIDSIQVQGTKFKLGQFHFEGLRHPYPFALALPQRETEHILEQKLLSSPNVTFLRDCNLVSIHKSQGKWYAETSQGVIQSEWLFGCDGEKSKVRQQLNISFPLKKSSTGFLMGDCIDNSSLGNFAGLYFTESGAVESFPLPGVKRRWIVQLPKNMPETISNGSELLTSLVFDRTRHRLHSNQLENISWFSPHQGMASRFYQDKVFLCGDSSHVMSPVGGQGMNLGFTDAWELAKLFRKSDSPIHIHNTDLKLWEKTRKKSASYATRRASINTWIGTRTGRMSSNFRNCMVFVYLKIFRGWNGKKRFAMLDLPTMEGT